METYFEIDTNEWGLGITFYKNVNIYDEFKCCIAIQILCAYIEIDFWNNNDN